MKLNIKRSLGKLDHYNIRIPPTLKKRLESLRKHAEDRHIDYTATLTATLEDFAAALEAHLDSPGIPQESAVTLSNGADSERAQGEYRANK